MKITLDITKHLPVLKGLITLASQLTVPEYLSYIYLGCSKSTLTLKATNLEATKIAEFDLDQEVSEDITILMHNQSLAQAIAIFNGKITIDFDKQTISQGSVKIYYKSHDPSDFPSPFDAFEIDESVPIWSDEELTDLKKAIDLTLPCADTSGQRARLQTLHLVSVGKNLVLEATNGYTLAQVTLLKESYAQFSTLIPISSIKHVKSFLETTAFPTITLAKGHILFKDSSQFIAVRLVQEDYPDTSSIIPKNVDELRTYEINDTLKRCLKQVAKVQTDKEVSHIALSVDKQNNFLIVGSDNSGHDLYEYADEGFEEAGCHFAKFSTLYLGHAVAHTTRAYQGGALVPLVCVDDAKKVLMLVMSRRS